MLLSLSIKNYALIEDLNIDFTDGFTVITGETGAGKSILIKSMELLCGARADSSAVRSGFPFCSISGVFECNDKKISDFLNALSVNLNEDGAIVLRRTVENAGRSKAFINDAPVSVSTLAEIGALLIDFHNQDEKHSLLDAQCQLEILDAETPNISILLEKTAKLYARANQIKADLEAAQMSEVQRERKIDLYSFQLQEINDAKLELGEEEKLENELPLLKNAEKIAALSQEVSALLYLNENSAISRIEKSKKNIENINNYGADASSALLLIEQSLLGAQEARREIENILAKIDLNSDKLNSALERAELIKKLKKKYGKNIEEILNYALQIETELKSLQNFEENNEKLTKELEETLKELKSLCKKISAERQKAAKVFCQNVQKELSQLEINNAVFDIKFDEKEPSSDGSDKIEFMFCANSGEKILPLVSSASGGELSRVLLAVEIASKSEKSRSQTVIFDEIDSGTGGKAGEKIGKKLAQLSNKKQVFLITHLAQSAAFAKTHIKVFKETKNSRVYAKAEILTEKEHIEEIARMVSGQKITKSAIEHAKELINLKQ
ncbi:MAG: DNA repair protein RecN [Endomicrobium sp.]|jgi:DNA repair protein RecN (Recombination protein N)|nr:DNA repair protein RecN [Endomicrobium sp.]